MHCVMLFSFIELKINLSHKLPKNKTLLELVCVSTPDLNNQWLITS